MFNKIFPDRYPHIQLDQETIDANRAESNAVAWAMGLGAASVSVIVPVLYLILMAIRD